MEAIENKSRYTRQESRREKILRIIRKFIWVFPLLAIAVGLLIAWQLIRSIQADSPGMPGVKYEDYIKGTEKPEKEIKKLEVYRRRMKEEKEEAITSRYEKIISGSEIVGKVDYGKIIPAEGSPTNEEEESIKPAEEITQKGGDNMPAHTPVEKPKSGIPLLNEREKKPISLPSRRDTLKTADSLSAKEESRDPFYTLKASGSASGLYTKAHFYGDQDILNGAFIRLRLGEDMIVNGKQIPRNTIFRGRASISQNKIEIQIDRIGNHEIKGFICDQDYQPGIVIPASKREGMEEAVTRSVYQTGSGTAMDLPFEILQDVSRNIIRNKQRKQSIIRINDGYLIYITLNNQ